MNRKNIGKFFWGVFGLVFTLWNLVWGNSNKQSENIIVTTYPKDYHKENTETAQPVYMFPVELAGKAFDFSGVSEARVVYVKGFTSSLVTQTSIGIGVMPAVVEVVNAEDGLVQT